MNGLVKRLKARGARVKVDTAGRVVGVRYTDRVIEKTDLDLLVECRVLQRLDLEGSRLDDSGLARLATITSLESLSLHDAKVTDGGLKVLGRLVRLKSLGLAGTGIGDGGLEHLSALGAVLRGLRHWGDLSHNESASAGRAVRLHRQSRYHHCLHLK